MPNNSLVLILCLVACPLGAQEEATARDMFHSAAGLLVPVKATSKTAGSPKPKQPAKPPAGARPAAPAAPAAIPAAASAQPLGLRYSIRQEAGPGRTTEVDPEKVFRSGDRIRLAIQSNDTAYLYIIQRGSSGNWSVLFPSPEINNGQNLVERGRPVEIPPGHWFAFDEQPGKETIFIVLSRQPEPNLEGMIYSLRARQAEESKPPKALLAQGRRIDDSLVGRVRSQVLSRDLVFEKVNEDTGGGQKEKAVYVVNKTGSAESRVVVDVTLNHQ